MDTQALINKLRPDVSALNALLADPEPGLFTWCDSVAYHWSNIARLWGEPETEQDRMRMRV